MNYIYISLIIAAGITVCALITKPKSDVSHTAYGLKIYLISFVISYISMTYLLKDGTIKQIIDTGEADF